MMEKTPYISRYRLSLLVGLFLLAIGLYLIVAVTNAVLTTRFSTGLHGQAEQRSSFYASTVNATLQRSFSIPLLLSRDPEITAALTDPAPSEIQPQLQRLAAELNIAEISLMDSGGVAIASSNEQHSLHSAPEDLERALNSSETVFSVPQNAPSGIISYLYRVLDNRQTLGAVRILVDLNDIADIWRRTGAEIIIHDASGEIILASSPGWQGRHLDVIIAAPDQTWLSKLNFLAGTSSDQARIGSEEYYLARSEIGFRNWELVFLTTTAHIRARVNAMIALEIMILSLMVSLGLFWISRSRARATQRLQAEGEELRALNARLSSEIAQNEKYQADLRVAEQSLAQTAKLAALGEMSAAVSHELNQPLAAIKTYMASARMLMDRGRPEEASAALGRVDALTLRMATIAKQLKSYSRQGDEEYQPVDLRDTIVGALSMMAPQLGQLEIELTKSIPENPVIILGDGLRLEQIVVNLLRNAFDAVNSSDAPTVQITLYESTQAHLLVEDNGIGIADKESLFEPFYTTKRPGEGVGLGLALSAGFANEMGGRLIARDAKPKGAIFELILPLLTAQSEAAE